MDINKIMITGRLTREPELRCTASNVPVLCFGIASNDTRKDKQTGQWTEYPNFVDCRVIGKRAEPLSKVLDKGMKVTIEGKLVNERWEKDGKKHSKHSIEVSQIVLPDKSKRVSEATDGFDAGEWQDPDPSLDCGMDFNF